MRKCIICKKSYKGYGHNALPIIEGRCCDECNERLVIPLRIRLHFAMDKYKQKLREKNEI